VGPVDCRMTDKSDGDSLFFGLLALALIPVSIAWRGFVIAKLWVWFVVPLGLAEIGMWHAAGLSALVAWVTDSSALTTQDDKKTPRERILYGVGVAALAPLLAWGIGAVIHAMM
jgi:hypothetical protein